MGLISPSRRSVQEMKHMENVSSLLQGSSPGEYQRADPKAEREAVAAPGAQPWEMIMDKKHFKLWRRPIEGTHLYQYRGNGAPRTLRGARFSSVGACVLRPTWPVFVGNWGEEAGNRRPSVPSPQILSPRSAREGSQPCHLPREMPFPFHLAAPW